jgi:hypothetical protein
VVVLTIQQARKRYGASEEEILKFLMKRGGKAKKPNYFTLLVRDWRIWAIIALLSFVVISSLLWEPEKTIDQQAREDANRKVEVAAPIPQQSTSASMSNTTSSLTADLLLNGNLTWLVSVFVLLTVGFIIAQTVFRLWRY